LSVVLRLPKADPEGVYDIEGVHKVLTLEGKRGYDYAARPNRAESICVHHHDEILRELVVAALGSALVSAVKGNPPAEQVGQDVIDRFFATSPLMRPVDPDKPLDMELAKDAIYIDIAGDSLDVEDRRIHNWAGIIDPLTTPQDYKAMKTFRLAGGATIVNDRIKRGKKLMCRTMEHCTAFVQNTKPTRILLTRSAFGKHEELVRWEDPLVCHVDYENGSLRGLHLYTAIMAGRYNYSDCLMISASAAQKMACYRRLNQSVVDTHTMELMVSHGATIKPDQDIIKIDEGRGKTRKVKARRLVTDAKLVGIKRTETHLLGEPAERIRLKYECMYLFDNGDKMTSRHGTKGVVRVVPDRKMPTVQTPNGPVIADVLLNPYSLRKRRPFGLHREMMLNALAMQENRQIRVRHFDDEYSMAQLVAMGLGEKHPVELKGRLLTNKVFAGYMYWLRLDMHARENLGVTGSTKPLNFIGLNPDAGKVSGQRLNLGMATVMHAKGLKETHKVLHAENVEQGAIRLIEDYMSVLAYSGQKRRRK